VRPKACVAIGAVPNARTTEEKSSSQTGSYGTLPEK
jgi:hypothetical protein